ncbi:lytic transglycosylase domain-containing protein [Paraburkholderia sp. JHI869]|uniref:lytic transglycosylase domain-containing protein n=1 Tax=Paraburkholderia sp. JHI869 TaxID=3112959 RepID=UPI00317BE2C0
MFTNSSTDFFVRTHTIAFSLRNIAVAIIVMFGSLSGLCYGAESPVWPMQDQVADITQERIPTAEEIATVVSAHFHIRWHDALEIGRAVLNAARRFTLPPLLLLSVIAVESSFDRFAESVVGAKGLMQVLPSQHRDCVLRTSDLTDARTNVRIGSAILQGYIRASGGNLEDALYRYSGGAKGYARRVADHLNTMKTEFGL